MPAPAASRLRSIAALCALSIAVLLIGVLPASANAASVVGPSGQINGCYKKKGKAKGTLRVVPAGKKCKKGEKRLGWNTQGPQGQNGGQGGTGTTGGTGDSGLLTQITDLKSQITQLTSQLTQLTAQVTSLCGQVDTLTTQANSTLTGLGAPNLTGTLLGLGSLGLSFPSLPSALTPYTCP
jgi:peptidoglycan hydrolase CwlO-like protein